MSGMSGNRNKHGKPKRKPPRPAGDKIGLSGPEFEKLADEIAVEIVADLSKKTGIPIPTRSDAAESDTIVERFGRAVQANSAWLAVYLHQGPVPDGKRDPQRIGVLQMFIRAVNNDIDDNTWNAAKDVVVNKAPWQRALARLPGGGAFLRAQIHRAEMFDKALGTAMIAYYNATRSIGISDETASKLLRTADDLRLKHGVAPLKVGRVLRYELSEAGALAKQNDDVRKVRQRARADRRAIPPDARNDADDLLYDCEQALRGSNRWHVFACIEPVDAEHAAGESSPRSPKRRRSPTGVDLILSTARGKSRTSPDPST
jgi:hypothetical protein